MSGQPFTKIYVKHLWRSSCCKELLDWNSLHYEKLLLLSPKHFEPHLFLWSLLLFDYKELVIIAFLKLFLLPLSITLLCVSSTVNILFKFFKTSLSCFDHCLSFYFCYAALNLLEFQQRLSYQSQQSEGNLQVFRHQS